MGKNIKFNGTVYIHPSSGVIVNSNFGLYVECKPLKLRLKHRTGAYPIKSITIQLRYKNINVFNYLYVIRG